MSKQEHDEQRQHSTSAEADVMPPDARARRRTLKQLRHIKKRTLHAKPYTADQVEKIKTRVEQAVMDAERMDALPLYNAEIVARLIATIQNCEAA